MTRTGIYQENCIDELFSSTFRFLIVTFFLALPLHILFENKSRFIRNASTWSATVTTAVQCMTRISVPVSSLKSPPSSEKKNLLSSLHRFLKSWQNLKLTSWNGIVNETKGKKKSDDDNKEEVCLAPLLLYFGRWGRPAIPKRLMKNNPWISKTK